MCDVSVAEILWCAGFDFLIQLNETLHASAFLGWLIDTIRWSITGYRPCDW